MGGEGKKAPCCHRLEKLIHIELADRANNPKGVEEATTSTPRKGKRKNKAEEARMSGKVCDCEYIFSILPTFVIDPSDRWDYPQGDFHIPKSKGFRKRTRVGGHRLPSHKDMGWLCGEISLSVSRGR
jgi:hypothetical protein